MADLLDIINARNTSNDIYNPDNYVNDSLDGDTTSVDDIYNPDNYFPEDNRNDIANFDTGLQQESTRQNRDMNAYDNTSALGSVLNSMQKKSNEYLGTDFDVTEVRDGKRYSSKNKTFNDLSQDELRDKFNNLEENPDSPFSLYYGRVIGEDGKASYKLGLAPVDAIERYKSQGGADGMTILYDKRVNGAEEFESLTHGNKSLLQQRHNDYGMDTENFGKGYTEIYNGDFLGLDDGSLTSDKMQQLNRSTSEKWKDLGLDMPTGRYDSKNREAATSYIDKRKAIYGDDDAEANKLEAQLKRTEWRRDNYIDDLQETPAAFLSGAGQLVTGVADFALDVITPGDNTWLNEYKSAKWMNNWAGFDSRESEFSMNKSLRDWKNGDYASAILTSVSNPAVVAQSLPEMAAMFVPIGAGSTALGKALVKAENMVIKGGEGVTAIGRAGAKTAAGKEAIKKAQMEAVEEMTLFQKASYHVAKNGGFYLTSAKQTNNILDERMKNNEDGEFGMGSAVMTFALTSALLATDRFAFSNIIKGSSLPDLKKMMSNLTDKGLSSVATKVVQETARLSEAGLKERISVSALIQ